MDVIAKLAKIAASGTEGVARLSAPIDVLVLPKSIDTFDVEVFLVIRFGYKIPEIAWNVQENIKKLLDEENIKNVDHINIHVEGVDFED